LFPKQQILNQTGGFCNITVSQHGIVDLSVQVKFVLTTLTPLASGSMPLSSIVCPNPSDIMYSKEGRRYCRPPCTGEELWSSAQLLCVAPDCVAVYQGYRNYWNERTGFCEAVPSCSSNEVYDNFTNSCETAQSTSITPSQGSVTNNNNAGDGTNAATSQIPPALSPNAAVNSVAQPNCGSHGQVSSTGDTCICDSGWQTNWLQTGPNIVWCSEQDTSPPSIAPQPSNTTLQHDSKIVAFFQNIHDLPMYVKIVGGGAIAFIGTVILLVILFACICIYKRRKAVKLRREKKLKRKKRKLKQKAIGLTIESDSSQEQSNEEGSDNDLDDQELLVLQDLEKRERDIKREMKKMERELEMKRNRRSVSKEEAIRMKMNAHNKMKRHERPLPAIQISKMKKLSNSNGVQ
jgi:hypothetical protein